MHNTTQSANRAATAQRLAGDRGVRVGLVRWSQPEEKS